MDFCQVCNNLLYFREQAPTEAGERRVLQKVCKSCGFSKVMDSALNGAVKITGSMYSEDDLLYMQYKNKYLRFDPTLPRVRDPNIRCPTAECPGNKEAGRVLYVKYHPVHMRFFFCCEECGTTWRREK